MNFEELGQTLKEERERRGLTVAAVVEATKISRTNIEAMESGDRSTLPHPVYAKGFVKSYARFLDLDADELGMVVDREFNDQECAPREPGYDVSPSAEKAFHGRDCSSPEGRRSRVVLVVALLFLIGVVGFLIFSFSAGNKDTASLPTASEQAAEESGALDGALDGEDEIEALDLPAEAGSDETSEPVNSGQQGAARPTDADPASQAAGAPPVAKKPEQAGSQDEEYTTTDAETDAQKYDHVLIIRATTPKGCWVGVWHGEETNMSRDFVLREGEPLRLMFNSPRRIRIGNVAGVTVTYNGKPYPLENARGNIQTLRFGTD